MNFQEQDLINSIDYLSQLRIDTYIVDLIKKQGQFRNFNDKKKIYVEYISKMIEDELLIDFYDLDGYLSSFVQQESPLEFVTKQFALRSERDLMNYAFESSYSEKKEDSLILYFENLSDAHRRNKNTFLRTLGFIEDGFAVSKFDMLAPPVIHEVESVPGVYGNWYSFVEGPVNLL